MLLDNQTLLERVQLSPRELQETADILSAFVLMMRSGEDPRKTEIYTASKEGQKIVTMDREKLKTMINFFFDKWLSGEIDPDERKFFSDMYFAIRYAPPLKQDMEGYFDGELEGRVREMYSDAVEEFKQTYLLKLKPEEKAQFEEDIWHSVLSNIRQPLKHVFSPVLKKDEVVAKVDAILENYFKK